MKEISSSPTFMIVAGELSGDILGAGLIKALKVEFPHAEFFGVGGPLMIAEGFESLAPIETLSVMGLFEVLIHLPKLLRLKMQLVKEAENRMPVAFIGVDAPDFNLKVAHSIKQIGITTFHYVSPSIWVWREKRIFTIKKSVDKVLCLFPFEVDLYAKHKMDASCVGHRLADEIPLLPNSDLARQTLQLTEKRKVLALLPGSRVGEVSRLLKIFVETAQLLLSKDPTLSIIIPAATDHLYEIIQQTIDELPAEFSQSFIILKGDSRLAMEASDVVLLASGTATLEAMLLKKPMVVAYKFSSITAYIARKVVRTPFFSLPNILARKLLVPEVFQEDVVAERLAPMVLDAFDQTNDPTLMAEYLKVHESLRLDADKAAAQAIINKLVKSV
ncbi:lipid-A-disaccharide synthase [Wohlfahrtiimonas larvae]|uniref:Lipid-A-disaccharide synthase n=1 Tax=Wohlfahrtiimonas larvae TaxID=1157986 RepID=A0ABP9MKG6_9GAMM|nr:lipid-A-disaccharide synthase [Wohlfahrtiimonas larvae]